jgi:hypothetical protein
MELLALGDFSLRDETVCEEPELMARPSRSRMYFLVKDPYWTFLWWKLSPAVLKRLNAEHGQEVAKGLFTLRIHDVTYIIFDGHNSHWFLDIAVHCLTDHWYLLVPHPGRVYCAEAGFALPDGRFIPAVRSNAAYVPRDRPAESAEITWSTIAITGS